MGFVRMKVTKAMREVQAASDLVIKGLSDDGLLPINGNDRPAQYTPEQAGRAAAFARQDAALAVMLQASVITRLDTIKRLLWACLIVLILIGLNLP